MNVERFLSELELILSDLPKEERDDVVDFFRSYIEDAGPENEAAVLADLGSPEKVARNVRAGLNNQGIDGEYAETGYGKPEEVQFPASVDVTEEDKYLDKTYTAYGELYKQRYAKKKAAQNQASHQKMNSENKQDAANARQTKAGKQAADMQKRKHRNPVAEVFLAILKVLMVIGAVCIVILLICALIVLICLVASAGGVTAGFLASGIGMLAGGAGFFGAATIGIAFIIFAIFLLLLAALVAFCKNALAGGIRGITSVTGDVVHERKRTRKAKEA